MLQSIGQLVVIVFGVIMLGAIVVAAIGPTALEFAATLRDKKMRKSAARYERKYGGAA